MKDIIDKLNRLCFEFVLKSSVARAESKRPTGLNGHLSINFLSEGLIFSYQ